MGVVVSSGGGSGAGFGDRIEVDPVVVVRAGTRMGSLGTQLGMLSDALGAALGSGIASGLDPAGMNFGMKYGHQAQEFADALAGAANAFKAVGYMLEATGHNYDNADAASTIGGSGTTGGVGGEPSKTMAGSAPLGPSSTTVSPPAKWSLIEPFLTILPGIGVFASAAMTWPSGNPALLRLAAAQWQNFATGLSAFDDDMAALKTAMARQRIPEGAKIGEALGKLGDQVSAMSGYASTIATSIDDFATGVQDTQDAIRRLLNRISLDGLWDTVTGFLTGDGDDILREVAHDVGEVLENFQNQVKGVVGLLGELAELIGDAATAFQKWIRPILVGAFGDGVGNALADTVTVYTDFQVGLVTGLINTVSGVVSLADPDTWEGMAEMAMSVAEDPSTLPGVLANMGKQFVAWDQWSGDHPGRAAGEAAFNIGTLFVPGGALSKSGTLAKGLSYTNRLLEEGRLPRLGDLPGLGSGNRNLPGLDELPGAGRGLPNIPEFRPGAVPDSVVGPVAPRGIDAPTTPHGLGSPSGPPDPPGPTGTPVGPNGHGSGGGDGPPPDPPGRPVDPSDSGTGHVSEPSTQSPGTSEPSTPSPAPSWSDPAAPAAQHAPESLSPATTPDGGPSPSNPGSTPTEHARTEHAPSENHRPGSDGYGHLEEHSPAPADHQPAYTSAADHPGGHERPATDGSPAREHPTSDGDGRSHDPTGTTPSVMPGSGMPMASHAPGGVHNSVDGQHSSGKTPAPETPARGTDAKGAQPGSPESPRAQVPAGAGPGAGNASAAPVNPAAGPGASTAAVSPAAGQHMSGALGETARPGPEPPAPRPGDSTRDGSPPPHPAPHDARGPAGPDRPGSQSHPGAGDPNTGPGNSPGQSPSSAGPVGNPADERVNGPHGLAPVEDPTYQTDVEHALRDADGNALLHADPRTNEYGRLINDGGPSVLGRSNNCLDCSLSALSSFLGDPTVSAPRYLDRLGDGTIDRRSGEQGGLRRAADWLGGGMLEFHGRALADQFDALHQYVNDLGPGSAALVHNGWHAVDSTSGRFLYHPDGSPMTNGSHATVVVYPDGAAGPVWWDPQSGVTFDHPPPSMFDRSSYLHFTPIEPNQGAHHGGVGNQGTGAGISGGDVANGDVSGSSVSPWVGVHDGPEPGADRRRGGTGDGSAGDRFGDGDRVRVPELVDADGGGGVHGIQTDGREHGGPPDLSVPVAHNDSPDPGGRVDERVSVDGGVADRSPGTDPRTSIDDPQAHIHDGPDGLAVGSGDVPRGVDEQSEPGSVAGGGHERGVTSAELAGADHRASASTSAGEDEHHAGSRPDNARHYSLMDETSHKTSFAPEQLGDNQRVADALDRHGVSRSDFIDLVNRPTDSLTPVERDLVNAVRDDLRAPGRDTVMQKVIPPGYFDNTGDLVQSRADDYIMGNNNAVDVNRVGGAVTFADDTAHLSTPGAIHDGLRLDYSDTPFAPHDPGTHVIRFQADPESTGFYEVPRNSDMGGSGAYDTWDDPFMGNGFTKSGDDVIPEYFAKNITMRDGAEMWEVLDDGTQRLSAILTGGSWIPQGN